MLNRRSLLGRLVGAIPALAVADEFTAAREKLTEPQVFTPKDFLLSDHIAIGNHSGTLWLSGIVPHSYCSG